MKPEIPKIFIVEDEAIVAMDIESCLATHNYDVIGRASSHKGLMRQIGDANPDLVLMDIRIQGELDGIECAKLVRNTYKTAVVFLTAHSDKKTLDRAIKTNAFGYVLKPFNEKTLVATIEMAISNHREEQNRIRLSDGFTNTLNKLNIGIIIFNMEGNITFLNIAARALTGWDKDKILNQPLKYFLIDKKLNKEFDVERIIKNEINLCHVDVIAQNSELHPMSFDLTISSMYHDGKLTGGMAIIDNHGTVINSNQDSNSKPKGITDVLEVCPWCKMWKDEKEEWNQIEDFIQMNTSATISHYICPKCHDKLIKSIQYNIEKDPSRRMN